MLSYAGAIAGMYVDVPDVAVVSLTVRCRALKLCKTPAVVVYDIRSRPASQVILETLEHILAAHAQPSPSEPCCLLKSVGSTHSGSATGKGVVICICAAASDHAFLVTLLECVLPPDSNKQHGLVAKPYRHLCPPSCA